MGILLRRRTREGLCTASHTFFFGIAILAMVALGMASAAWAHRDRGPDDPCRRQLGASLLHLTLYQPQVDPDGEYCDEVPREGKTVMVVDVTAGELREGPMSIEVIETSDSGVSRTILSLPPTVYRWGVADTEVTLNAGNTYIARVLVAQSADTEPQLLSFPIHVGAWYKAMIIPALMVVAVLALTTISVIRYSLSTRQDRSATKRVPVA